MSAWKAHSVLKFRSCEASALLWFIEFFCHRSKSGPHPPITVVHLVMRKQLDDLRTEAHPHASLRPVSDSECGSQGKKRDMLTGQVCMCSIILLPMAGTAEEPHARVGG